MPILNGFMRGAHDPEITANIDQKDYAGVATSMKNLIATKRGALSKRAPFVFRRGLEPNSYFIPYIYDQDQRYLMQFFVDETDGKTKYRMINYFNGTLTNSTIGVEPAIIQPTFTSDSQDEYETSQSKEVGGIKAYQRFNEKQPMTLSESKDYYAVIKFPKPCILSKLEVLNYRKWYQTIVNPSRPGFITITHTNYISFVVEGSTNGQDWVKLTPNNITGNIPESQIETGVRTYSQSDSYQYYRIRATGTKQQSYVASEECYFGDFKLTVLLVDDNLSIESPYTIEQARELHWANENKRMVLLHPDLKPYELLQTLQELNQTGLDFDEIGYPTFGCFYQERLCLGGFTIANRQFNMSKSNPKNDTNFDFTLPTGELNATDAMQFVIRNAKYPLRETLSGRNVVYLQCIDGLATVSSGGDEVPLTPTQVSASLRNHTPMSDIPAVYQEELAFLVGSDYKTVYAMDFDFNVMRVRTEPINEHCMSYFESGIAQMITMKGQLPYLVFRLNNGKILVANAYRTTTGFRFSLFPLEIADGNVSCIATLMNNQTGYDTLFAIIEHSNGIATLESLESVIEAYSEARGRQYFIDNIMLDMRSEISVEQKNDITFTYSGTVSNINKVLFTISGGTPTLPDKEIKLVFLDNSQNTKEIICKNCEFDSQGMWAEVSETPPESTSIAYIIPSKTWGLEVYSNLPVLCFDGDDFIEKESEDDKGNITFKRPIYKGTVGLSYDAYAEFENITDVNGVMYEKVITSIAASITYGTGIMLGSESTLEKVGFSDYNFSKWQDRILPDESLRDIVLQDEAKKGKKIVLKCPYPFPANITFIVYNIKITGSK